MKIHAIVVLYNDNNIESVNHISLLAQQVDKVFLIDNSSDSYADIYGNIERVVYLPQYKNLGIAAAQNIGINMAINNGAEFILFADPDSSIPENAISKLLAKHILLTSEGFSVGSIGSTAYNANTGQPYPLFTDYIQQINKYHVTEVTYTMNSISLIKKEMFEKVGLMNEQLFIDGVDSEWCWRAHAKIGARFYLDDNVIIKHQLGIGTRKIMGKDRSLAAPYRLFYQYRNYLWFLRCSYIPKPWLRLNGKKYFLKMIYYSLFAAPRWQYFKNIVRGIAAGIKTSNNQLSL